MNYFYTLVQKENPEISEEHVKEVIKVLYKAGCISVTLQRNYEIYLFFCKKIRECEEHNYPRRVAWSDTQQEFSISYTYLFKICKFFKGSQVSDAE